MENQPDEVKTGLFLKQWESQVRPYIEMIDYLRRIGIEKDLALPSIAVVGDQSSGKSSVLEALSGVALPRGSGKRYQSVYFYMLSFSWTTPKFDQEKLNLMTQH